LAIPKSSLHFWKVGARAFCQLVISSDTILAIPKSSLRFWKVGAKAFGQLVISSTTILPTSQNYLGYKTKLVLGVWSTWHFFCCHFANLQQLFNKSLNQLPFCQPQKIYASFLEKVGAGSFGHEVISTGTILSTKNVLRSLKMVGARSSFQLVISSVTILPNVQKSMLVSENGWR
jgi:hypothetical protein